MRTCASIVSSLLLFTATLLIPIASSKAASAIAFDKSTGAYAFVADAPTVDDAKRDALARCPGGEIVAASGKKGVWAISISRPLFIGQNEPYVLGYSAGGKDWQGTMNDAYDSCRKLGGKYANLGEAQWEEKVGEPKGASGKITGWHLKHQYTKEMADQFYELRPDGTASVYVLDGKKWTEKSSLKNSKWSRKGNKFEIQFSSNGSYEDGVFAGTTLKIFSDNPPNLRWIGKQEEIELSE